MFAYMKNIALNYYSRLAHMLKMLSDFAYVYICASALRIIFTNPRRMRCRIIVVVWPVCLSVCLSVCLCVTANLEASNDGYQWHQRDMAIIKTKRRFL